MATLLFNNYSADTPHFRWGNPYFFTENLYQSVSFIYASMYRENVHAIHITMRFAKKIVTLCNINRQPAAKNQNRSFTSSRGATVGVGLRLWLTRSIVLHGRRNLRFFGNLAEKASCVEDKNCFVSLHIGPYSSIVVFSNLPQIRIITWYGRIISKKAKIRTGYGQSVPCGMSDSV